MYGRRFQFHFPAVILVAVCLQTILCTAVDLPAQSADVEGWITDIITEYNHRTAEIAMGVNVTLDPVLLQAEAKRRLITVQKDGAGDFKTVTDAVKSIPSGNSRRVIIKIGPGVYNEKVTIDQSRPFITLYGNPDAMPTITFNGTAAVFGTLDSATVAVESNYFVACNIIFENSAPKPAAGAKGEQAVAMRISGDKAAFHNCKFHGFQDTLCDDKGLHFFKDCDIQGTVDFIFGNGRSIYLGCLIKSLADDFAAITAQARSSISDKSGFSFINCTITGSGDVYLGRAWRVRSRVIFSYTYMGKLINPKGWDDKGVLESDRTVYYGEYKCMGPGSVTNQRASYVKVLTDEQATPFLSLTFIHAKTWLLPPIVDGKQEGVRSNSLYA